MVEALFTGAAAGLALIGLVLLAQSIHDVWTALPRSTPAPSSGRPRSLPRLGAFGPWQDRVTPTPALFTLPIRLRQREHSSLRDQKMTKTAGKPESNSGGQYGWIEQETGLPISTAITELLAGEQQP